jgi:iron complex outermembrane receptor protein
MSSGLTVVDVLAPARRRPHAWTSRRGAASVEGVVHMNARLLYVSAVIAAAGLGEVSLGAQPTGAPGSVSGVVTSRDGARLPFAVVTLVCGEASVRFLVATDVSGTYRADRLPSGTCDLEVDAPGFARFRKPAIVVAPGRQATVDVVLDVAGLDEVVTVTGQAPRGAVEHTQLRESGARDVAEALAGAAGVWKLRKGGIASDVVVRGLQSRDLNVLVDGERVYGACPNHMDPPAFHVDFAEVERVEVGKGPFDVRNHGSLGGLVNIVTRRPDQGWHANPTLGVGSFGYVNPAATVSFASPRMAAVGGASYRRSDPYADGRGRRFTEVASYAAASRESDAFRAVTGWARAGGVFAGQRRLQVAYTRQQADHVLYPYLLMDAVFDDTDRVSVRYEDASATGPLSGVRTLGYWTRVHHWMTDEYRTSAAGTARGYSMGTMADTETVGVRAEAVAWGATFGAETFRRTWSTTTSMSGMQYARQYSIPDVDTEVAGLFVETARAVRSDVTLSWGVRVDGVRTTADAAKANLALYKAYKDSETTRRTDVVPSGKLRVTWTPQARVEVAGGIGHVSRVAEANERFFALRRMGTDWVGNPDLEPSRNTGADVSVTLRLRRASVATSLFLHDVRNYIAVHTQPRVAMVPGVMNTRARSYANVDARLRGGEVSATAALSARLFLSADVSYTRGTQTPRPELGIRSRNLAEMPPLRVQLRLRFDDGRLFAGVEGLASAAQRKVDADLGELPTPSAAVVNLHAGLRQGRFSATVGVANLLDQYFVDHLSFQRDPFRTGVRVPEPGRHGFVNVGWKF